MSTDIQQPAAGGFDDVASGHGAANALDLMARALELLDDLDAPADVGAHLDHAMHRLLAWIEAGSGDIRVTPTKPV